MIQNYHFGLKPITYMCISEFYCYYILYVTIYARNPEYLLTSVQVRALQCGLCFYNSGYVFLHFVVYTSLILDTKQSHDLVCVYIFIHNTSGSRNHSVCVLRIIPLQVFPSLLPQISTNQLQIFCV